MRQPPILTQRSSQRGAGGMGCEPALRGNSGRRNLRGRCQATQDAQDAGDATQDAQGAGDAEDASQDAQDAGDATQDAQGAGDAEDAIQGTQDAGDADSTSCASGRNGAVSDTG